MNKTIALGVLSVTVGWTFAGAARDDTRHPWLWFFAYLSQFYSLLYVHSML